MENGLTYDREIVDDFGKLNYEHKKVLELIGKNKTVLEVGCHTGYFSSNLKKNNCQITGIDIYEPCIVKANKYLEKGIVGNIEDEKTLRQLSNQKFDIILLMHVLEHLVNPEVVLCKLQKNLKENGRVIICLPNISNWNSRMNLFKGKFDYTESGLMDKTHLRFFNVKTAKIMLKSSGYILMNYHGTGKVHFSIIPNFKFIWRLNKIIDKILIKLLSKRSNLIDTSMLFEVKLDNKQ